MGKFKQLYVKIKKYRYKSLACCLRQFLQEWEEETRKHYEYRCVLTKSDLFIIHHLYDFDLIIKEALKITGFPALSVKRYTQDQLERLIMICKYLHKKHGLGVCLHPSLHELFHKLYGYEDNNVKQFEEFKERYKNGEFYYL